jgi:hypothetical protein
MIVRMSVWGFAWRALLLAVFMLALAVVVPAGLVTAIQS